MEVCVEGRTPLEMKNTPNHHYNGTFVEPWGERSQRGYGIEILRRFFEEVATVEFGGPPDQRDDRLKAMRALTYNDLSADRNCVAIVQAMEAILKRHADGDPGALVEVNGRAGGLVLYPAGVNPRSCIRVRFDPLCKSEIRNPKSETKPDRLHFGFRILVFGFWYSHERRAGVPVSREELEEVVRTNAKQRFAFDETGTRIRANQGHSVEIDLQLQPAIPPDVLFHGTADRFLTAILTDGLRKMDRQHVHLSVDAATAIAVGSRHGKPVVLTVDAAGMTRAGHVFRVSANGVWLTASPFRSCNCPRADRMTTASIAHPGELASNAEASAAVTNQIPPNFHQRKRSRAQCGSTTGPRRAAAIRLTSGVLVANSGTTDGLDPPFLQAWAENRPSGDYFPAMPMTAYNALTLVETEASKRLVNALRQTPGGARLDQVMWAASGSEAIQKALWAGLARDKNRPIILATRYGFHGKKGLAGAVTGTEHDAERDPRVRFITFPMRECIDVENRDGPIDLVPYRKELDELRKQLGRKLGVLITEPYLGGGGSFHPPKAYLQMLQQFCRESDLVFILDEVQANFGRTGKLFAFETYELEPDVVVLGKGLGNGIPVAAAVGRKDLFATLDYGEGSDTWSANPLCCSAVLATLDEFEGRDIIGHVNKVSPVIEEGLVRLKRLPFVAHVRGEKGGMVWGVETKEYAGRTAAEWAEAVVLGCYRGDGKTSDGIHRLGPLSKKVVGVSPPIVSTEAEARTAMELMNHLLEPLPGRVGNGTH